MSFGECIVARNREMTECSTRVSELEIQLAEAQTHIMQLQQTLAAVIEKYGTLDPTMGKFVEVEDRLMEQVFHHPIVAISPDLEHHNVRVQRVIPPDQHWWKN